MADKQVTFGIRVVADSNAGEAANSVEELRKRIQESQEAVKSYQTTLRQLRGTTEEVRVAKEKLKGAVEAEKNAVSSNALALGKLGTTYAQATRAAKQMEVGQESLKEKTRALRDALKVGGDETRRLAAAFDFADRFAANSTVALISLGAAAGFLTAALGVGLVGALAVASVELSKFAIESGNLLRTQGLDREAAMGGTENAEAFASQIESLRQRIPATREELNKLAIAQFRLYDATRVSGQGIVDAWTAVASITSAVGKNGGEQIGERISSLLSREKNRGRFGLNSFGPGQITDELQGTGIKSIEVAKQLSKNLNIGLVAAERQLYLHRVKLDDGARAIKEVIDARFGAVNVKRFYDLDTIVKRLHDNLQGLFKDFGIEKVLEDVDQLARNFDVAYANGYGLKALLDGFGELLGVGFDKGTDALQGFFDHAVNIALKLEVKALDVRDKLREWKAEGLDFMQMLESVVSGPLKALEAGFQVIVHQIEIAERIWEKIHGSGPVSAPDRQPTSFSRDNDNGTGRFAPPVYGAETDPALRKAYERGRLIGLGQDPDVDIAPAHAKGGRVMQPAPGEVFASVAPDELIIPAPQAKLGFPSGEGSGKRSMDATVQVMISLPNVKDGKGFAQALSNPNALADITQVFEDLFHSMGSPTQTPAAGAGP